jgi:hypothetical protein
MSNQGQSPPDPFSGGFKPMAAPNSAGGAYVPPKAPSTGVTIIGGGGGGGSGVTAVNSTGDSRVLWEDGHIAIIFAKDFPANSGMGRSKTRDTVAEAIKATVDDQLQSPVGGGSMGKFVKVWLKELLARPVVVPGGGPKVMARLPIDPSQFKPVSPVIPDFPHDCIRCGGKMYQGMFSNVHPTPDGKCPSEHAKVKKR